MNHPKDSHLNTIALAETALTQISTHGQPADPKSFELWYRFATGKSGLLSAAINSRLERSGTLTRKVTLIISNRSTTPTATWSAIACCGS